MVLTITIMEHACKLQDHVAHVIVQEFIIIIMIPLCSS